MSVSCARVHYRATYSTFHLDAEDPSTGAYIMHRGRISSINLPRIYEEYRTPKLSRISDAIGLYPAGALLDKDIE